MFGKEAALDNGSSGTYGWIKLQMELREAELVEQEGEFS